MQQTEKYQFNLIEPSDTFSPDPLNENMEKVEVQLDTVRAEAAAGDAALEQRVQVLELHKFAYGYYTGNGEKAGDSQIIEVGFTPKILITHLMTCTEETPQSWLKIVPGGFQVTLTTTYGGSTNTINTKGAKHAYFAFA